MRCPNCSKDFLYNQDKPIVVLGVPALDSTIHFSIMAQWNHLLHNYRSLFVVKDNTYIDIARNKIVLQGRSIAEATYGQLPDYYLFVDSDTVIGKRNPSKVGDLICYPEFVDQMIARDKPIVSGWYVKKRDMLSQAPVFGNGDPDSPSLWVEPPDRLLPVDWIGAGYLLVKREVFEKIPEPWFQNCNDPMPQGYRRVGEDIYFCNRVKEYGFPIFVDLNVKVGHYGSVAWPPEEE